MENSKENKVLWAEVKSIPNLCHSYLISSNGEVFDATENKKVKSYVDSTNYGCVYLRSIDPKTKEERKTKYLLQKIVAKAFVENPNNYKYIIHKDNNKTNNAASNLEWSKTYDVRRGSTIYGLGITTKKQIRFNSISEACTFFGSKILCHGKKNKSHGFIWSTTPFYEKGVDKK